MNTSQMLENATGEGETLEAIRIWLSGLYELGEEIGLITAIQRDRRIDLDDDEIAYVLADAVRAGIAAETALDRLVATAAGGAAEE